LVNKEFKLSEIAKLLDLSLEGDQDYKVCSINNLKQADKSDISFYYSKKFKKDLENTNAGAVILSKSDDLNTIKNKLFTDQVHLAYAKCSQLFTPKSVGFSRKDNVPVIHEGAIISPNSNIETNVKIEDGVVIKSGVFIGSGSIIKKNTLIHSNVSIYSNSVIGRDCILHSGAVIGSDGLGFAKNGKKWEKIIHHGNVEIGNSVEIGAGCTIDKASSGKTIINDGVKLDNQIHLAHNCFLGENTIIGANTSIAGSVKVGKSCMIGGLCGIVDNIEIVDEVIIHPMTFVTNNIKNKGVYSGGPVLMEHKDWLKKIAIERKKR
tara:strand:- start:335 stop:1297 length:963 start_codon:yes stop_codon:yes gene_type:complete